MKAYKCPYCGWLHRFDLYNCIKCGEPLIAPERVEIIDWDKELLGE